MKKLVLSLMLCGLLFATGCAPAAEDYDAETDGAQNELAMEPGAEILSNIAPEGEYLPVPEGFPADILFIFPDARLTSYHIHISAAGVATSAIAHFEALAGLDDVQAFFEAAYADFDDYNVTIIAEEETEDGPFRLVQISGVIDDRLVEVFISNNFETEDISIHFILSRA